jgi:5-methylthioribose kinase
MRVAEGVAVSLWQALFMDSTEALIHGDLHTGSVMVTEGEAPMIHSGHDANKVRWCCI